MIFKWKKLYQALDDLRKGSGGESWRSLATRSGVTPSLFTRISQGKPTSVGNLLKLLAILSPYDKEVTRFELQEFVSFRKARMM